MYVRQIAVLMGCFEPRPVEFSIAPRALMSGSRAEASVRLIRPGLRKSERLAWVPGCVIVASVDDAWQAWKES